MEHPCIQCGAAVEDGRPFCPGCHAPQIRVPVRPPTAPATEPLPPGTPEDVQPPAEPVLTGNRSAEDESSLPAQSPRLGLVWKPAVGATVIAGLLAAVGTSLGVIPLTLLCMFASGGLAVTIYQRLSGQRKITSGMGIRLGVLAGGWGFGVLALLSTFELFTAEGRAAVHKLLEQQIQTALAANADPAKVQAFEQLRGYLATDHGVLLICLVGMLLVGIFFAAASALGGALGATLFGRDEAPRA